MQLNTFEVSRPTLRLIEGLAVLRTHECSTRTLVAESRVSVGIRIAGHANVWRHDAWQRLPRCSLTGVHLQSRIVRTEAGSTLVLAHLHPAAAPVLGLTGEQLVDRTIDLSSVWPEPELDALSQRMTAAADDALRAAELESFVAHKLSQAQLDAAVVAAVDRIRSSNGEARIADVVMALGLSVDTLERRFRHCVGASPKRLARALRLRAAVLSYSAGMTLTQVALEAGYYDQSHFVRDMRSATGQAPKRLLLNDEFC